MPSTDDINATCQTRSELMAVQTSTNDVAATPEINDVAATPEINDDDLRRLRHFLELGSETGFYSTFPVVFGSRDIAAVITRLISSGKGEIVVAEILRFHVEDMSARPEAVIFALAVCARDGADIKSTVYRKTFAEVCKTPAQLFLFVDYAQKLSRAHGGGGWGKAHRKAISAWYNDKSAPDLATLVTGSLHRHGWTHRDVIKMAHVKPANEAVGVVLLYVMKGYDAVIQTHGDTTSDDVRIVVDYLKVVHTVKRSDDPGQVARLIEENSLSMAVVPTRLHKSKQIWLSLLRAMSLADVMTSLARLSTIGLLDGHGRGVDAVLTTLTDDRRIVAERVHPLQILIALKSYEYNKTDCHKRRTRPGEFPPKPKARYLPNTDVINSLKKSFYSSFKHLPSTNKRFLVAVDLKCSLTVGRSLGSSHVTPLVAGAALAMTVARSEPHSQIMVYDSGLSLVKLDADHDLEQVCKLLKRDNSKTTDCRLPLIWAMEKMEPIDEFIIITDKAPSLSGSASAAIKQYRDVMAKPNTRMLSCFLTTNSTTEASTGVADPLIFDMCGFDLGAVKMFHNFVQNII